MVQFQVNKNDPEEYACGICKSYNEGFCFKWSFPIRENHVPCTKFRKIDRIQVDQSNNNELIPPDLVKLELILEFFQDLKKFKEEIIGKPFDEIYINLDTLIDEYKEKFNIEI